MYRQIPGLILMICVLSACALAQNNNPKATNDEGTPADSSIPADIKLSSIGRIKPKGRIQDPELNNIKTIEYLVAVGKPSIPWLIGQLDDETKIDHRVMDYWYQTYVGDLAFIVLGSLFQDRKGQSTIPGFGWDEFLERESPDDMAEAVLRDYIEKHGRKRIKTRWQEYWNANKDRIEWDQACYCFRTDKANEN